MKGHLFTYGGQSYLVEDDGRTWRITGRADAVPLSRDAGHALAEEIGYAEAFEGETVELTPWALPDHMPGAGTVKEKVPLDQRIRDRHDALRRLLGELVAEGSVELDGKGTYHMGKTTEDVVLIRLNSMLGDGNDISRKTLYRDVRDAMEPYGFKVKWSSSKRNKTRKGP